MQNVVDWTAVAWHVCKYVMVDLAYSVLSTFAYAGFGIADYTWIVEGWDSWSRRQRNIVPISCPFIRLNHLLCPDHLLLNNALFHSTTASEWDWQIACYCWTALTSACCLVMVCARCTLTNDIDNEGIAAYHTYCLVTTDAVPFVRTHGQQTAWSHHQTHRPTAALFTVCLWCLRK